MSEDTRYSGEYYELDGDAAPKSYEEWKEETETAELCDQFFLHEMRIASCEFFNGSIVVIRGLLTEEVAH